MKKNNQLFVVIVMIAVFFSYFVGDVSAQEKTIRKVSTTKSECYVLDPNLDKVWKPAFKYAIVIPNNASIKSYFDVMKKLERGSVYKANNTIVFCTQTEEGRAKEIAGSYTICVSCLLPSADEQEISFYTIQKKKEGEFDYLLNKIEVHR